MRGSVLGRPVRVPSKRDLGLAIAGVLIQWSKALLLARRFSSSASVVVFIWRNGEVNSEVSTWSGWAAGGLDAYRFGSRRGNLGMFWAPHCKKGWGPSSCGPYEVG